MRNEPAEDPITADEVINTEFSNPEETPNWVQETELETGNDRVEPVGDLVVTNLRRHKMSLIGL
jgi:hypothetical protein